MMNRLNPQLLHKKFLEDIITQVAQLGRTTVSLIATFL